MKAKIPIVDAARVSNFIRQVAFRITGYAKALRNKTCTSYYFLIDI